MIWLVGLLLCLMPAPMQDAAPDPGPDLARLSDKSLPLAERMAAADALGRSELGLTRTAERSAALAGIASSAPDADLRAAALTALARVEGGGATQVLVRLVRTLPPTENLEAAKLLVKRPGSAGALLEVMRASTSSDSAEGAPDGAVLAELFGGFGRAFVDAGSADDARLFVMGHLHADHDVRVAADLSLDTCLQRLGTLRDDERALALFEELAGSGWSRAGSGWSRAEMRVREATFLLASGRSLERALESARSVEALTRGRRDFSSRRLRFFGFFLEASCQLAAGAPEAAFAPLMRSSLVVDGMNMARLDLVPNPARPSKVTGAEAGELMNLRGLVELTAAYVALASGLPDGDELVLEHLQRAHEFNLWSQLRYAATDDSAGPGSFDELIEHDFAPRRLIFSAPDNPVWSGAGRGRAIDLSLAIGRAARLVLGSEMPGFEPPAIHADGFGAPRADPRRFTLLKLLRPAELAAVQRRQSESWDQYEMQMLEMRRRGLSDQIEKDRESDYKDLNDLRLPSTFALSLVEELRAEDRAEEAVALATQLYTDLESAGRLDEGAWGAWLAARVEISRGGALGDADRPKEAIDVLESAVHRLEAVENTILERKSQERDPRRLSTFDNQLKQTQRLRAQALVGLAVNSNVRLGDPERALVYFEAAYKLDDSDFMRGLLACYRARFGATEEARSLLRTIRPAPAVYYNLACAYSLLGDADQAIEMLQREFDENHPTPGSLARQKKWSREDPDLASIADDPRFIKMTAE